VEETRRRGMPRYTSAVRGCEVAMIATEKKKDVGTHLFL